MTYDKKAYDAERYKKTSERKKAMTAAYRLTARGKETKAAASKKARARLRELVAEIKSAPCMDCGGAFPPYCMDFDHRRGQKKVEVARMVGADYSVKAVLDEIAKCDVVCSNCHRIRTWGKK